MLKISNVTKTYRMKKSEDVVALKDISLSIEETGMVFVLGKSGSGKSTFLNVLGGLDRFDCGEIEICGKSSKDFNQSDFDSYRNTFIGFIFQEYNILEDFTVGANIALAIELQGKKATSERVEAILEKVDLAGFGNRKPNELSGGQKQRVAIARALIKEPQIIMADEPTGALDSNTGKQVFDTLKKLSKEKLVIIVSHDREFAETYADRIIEFSDGEIISDVKKTVIKANHGSKGMQVVKDKLIHIAAGYHLSDEELNEIRRYVSNAKSETIISFDQKANEVYKGKARIDQNGNQEVFESTKKVGLFLGEYDEKEFKLIRSHLPLKDSLKMAFSSLRTKRFRLVVTILLSMVAFSMFGLSNTLSSYDRVETTVNSIKDSNIDYLSLVGQDAVGSANYRWFQDNMMDLGQVKDLKEKYSDLTFYAPYRDDLYSTTYSILGHIGDVETLQGSTRRPYYTSILSSFLALSEEDVDKLGFTITGEMPKKENEIVITTYLLEHFIEAGYRETSGENSKVVKVSNAGDIIGKKLNLEVAKQWKEFVISGVIDTGWDSSRYQTLKEEQTGEFGFANYMLESEMNSVLKESFHSIGYIAKDYYQQLINSKRPYAIDGNESNLMLIMGEGNYYDARNCYQWDNSLNKDIIYLDPKSEELADDELIVSFNFIKMLRVLSGGQEKNVLTLIQERANYSKDKAVLYQAAQEVLLELKDEIIPDEISLEFTQYSDESKQSSKQYTIAGVLLSKEEEAMQYYEESYDYELYIKDGFLESFGVERLGFAPFAIAKMPSKQSEIREIVKWVYDESDTDKRVRLSNAATYLLYQVNDFVDEFAKVALYVAIGFAVFAAIMLMNFIATSIAHKKRQIGILRAVGATSKDVFMIFFHESLMIALINWVLSIMVTVAGIMFINQVLRNEYGILITILSFGLKQVILMLIISVGVAFAASFLPVYRIARKKPIDAIRG